MFTGLVQGLGRITAVRPVAGEIKLTVAPDFDWGEALVMGESIAVSGACLTVTEIDQAAFSAHVSAETLNRTALRGVGPGLPVNLERALRLSDRLGGHLVTGHVDAVSRIKSRVQRGASQVVSFSLEPDLAKLVIEKGSVAVDGVSLTVNATGTDWFEVNVIPHTLNATTLSFKKPGDHVNLETDLIGKYVARFLGGDDRASKISARFLAEHGFL